MTACISKYLLQPKASNFGRSGYALNTDALFRLMINTYCFL